MYSIECFTIKKNLKWKFDCKSIITEPACLFFYRTMVYKANVHLCVRSQDCEVLLLIIKSDTKKTFVNKKKKRKFFSFFKFIKKKMCARDGPARKLTCQIIGSFRALL